MNDMHASIKAKINNDAYGIYSCEVGRQESEDMQQPRCSISFPYVVDSEWGELCCTYEDQPHFIECALEEVRDNVDCEVYILCVQVK